MKVGELVAYLSLDTSGMTKGVDKATQEGKRLDNNMASLKTGATIAAGALTAVGYAAMEAANRAGDYADQIKEVAVITGMSTDQVQRWKYAADQSGVSFDALTVTMRMLTQNIQNVDDKNSSLKLSLDSLGVSAKTANGQFKDTNTLMLETLTALKNMDDPVRRNTIAMQLYGRSWSELADFMEKDIDLSNLMSKADPISKAKLDAAENYKNKMNGLSSSLDQVTIKIGTSLIPALNLLTNWFAGAVPYVTGFVDALMAGIDSMAIAAARAADTMNGTMNTISGIYGGDSNRYTTNNEARVIAEIQARNSSFSPSSSGGGSGVPYFDSGSSGSSTGSIGGTSIKQWTAQEIYNKYQGGPINKPQMEAMLVKEGLLGAVVQTKNGQYYNTATGMYSNNPPSTSSNPYVNFTDWGSGGYDTNLTGKTTRVDMGDGTYKIYGSGVNQVQEFAANGTDITGSTRQYGTQYDPSVAANPLVGWSAADVSAVQTAIQTIWEPPAGGYKNYYTGEVSETLPAGVPPVEQWPVSELSPGLVVKNYAGWMAGGYVINKAVQDAAKQSIREVFAKGGYGDAESFISTINTGSKTSALSWGMGFKAPTVEAPTVTDYGTSQVSYTSSGAIKSNYSMGITQGSNGVLTVNLLLDGKVVAQSVVDNLASLGVRV